MKSVFILLIGFILMFPFPVLSETQQNIWGCGDKIVRLGDSKATVLMNCGEPTIKGKSGTQITGTYREKIKGDYASGSHTEKIEEIEEWVYNCGSYNFNRYLTFKGDRLNLIVLKEYGTGESYCNGTNERTNNKISIDERETQLNNESTRGLIESQTRQIEEDTYQKKMKAYDEKIKALEKEADKYNKAYKDRMKEEEKTGNE